MNAKYLILIAGILAVIRCLFAGSAPPATPAGVAPQAKVAPIAPSPVSPTAPVAPGAPVGPPPATANVAPVSTAPIAPLAPVAPTPPQSVNSNFPAYSYGYAYTYGSNSANFTNGIPTAYFRNTNSLGWITNAPYGNPTSGYTNNTVRYVLPYRPMGSTSSPAIH